MASLDIQQHNSQSYSPRTFANAAGAEWTVAFASDFTTSGERLTKKAAGARYVPINIGGDPVAAARVLYKALRASNARSLNVAGNGIYTLSKDGWSQLGVNRWVYQVLAKVHEHWPLNSIRSGGQTGVDIAGVAAAYALGIAALALFPKGYLQRGTDKVDREHTEPEIRALILGLAADLAREGNSSGSACDLQQ